MVAPEPAAAPPLGRLFATFSRAILEHVAPRREGLLLPSAPRRHLCVMLLSWWSRNPQHRARSSLGCASGRSTILQLSMVRMGRLPETLSDGRRVVARWSSLIFDSTSISTNARS